MDAGWQSEGSRIVATIYYLFSEIWNGSPVTESSEADLENVESLKTSVDEDIDSLKRVSKDNNDKELEQEAILAMRLVPWPVQLLTSLL